MAKKKKKAVRKKKVAVPKVTIAVTPLDVQFTSLVIKARDFKLSDFTVLLKKAKKHFSGDSSMFCMSPEAVEAGAKFCRELQTIWKKKNGGR